MSKRWPYKVIIGLTGNIATGKSAVMRMAAEQGALTLDADKIVHQILSTDPAVQTAVVEQFGDDIKDQFGRINRASLAAIVFQNPAALARLEQILHPVVRTVVIEQINNNEANVVMIEAIKLLEGKLAAECDHIWVTRCPEARQIERLRVCRGLDAQTAAMRVNAQSSQEEKVAQADVVIDTNGTMDQTRTYFELAWERIVQGLPAGVQPATAVTPLSRPKADPAEMAPAGPVTGRAEVVAEPVAERASAIVEAPETPKSPPERLSSSKAAEIRKRMLARKQGKDPEPVAEPASGIDDAGPVTEQAEVVVRRARPSDVPSILLLIQRATAGTVKIKRGDLLMALGERGYLIGQKGTEISSVFGWSSENLIARIDQIFVHPPEAASVTGPAVLDEVEQTALSLMCEVILAFPPNGLAPAVLKLFLDKQFEEVEWVQLPDAWKSAVSDSQPENTFILLKKLRDTRIVAPL